MWSHHDFWSTTLHHVLNSDSRLGSLLSSLLQLNLFPPLFVVPLSWACCITDKPTRTRWRRKHVARYMHPFGPHLGPRSARSIFLRLLNPALTLNLCSKDTHLAGPVSCETTRSITAAEVGLLTDEYIRARMGREMRMNGASLETTPSRVPFIFLYFPTILLFHLRPMTCACNCLRYAYSTPSTSPSHSRIRLKKT